MTLIAIFSLVEQLSQLFTEAVTKSRLNFKLKTKIRKITLVNYIIHIIYLLLFH